VRVFKTRPFSRFARKASIRDAELREAVAALGRGQIDASLGGGVYKQRLARKGQGKSGGFRVVLAYRSSLRAVFIFGFAKNEMDNIGPDELAVVKKFAAYLFGLDHEALDAALEAGELIEVECDA
jgi:hypothetical protein